MRIPAFGIAALVSIAPAAAGQQSDALTTFLRNEIGLGSAELTRVARGEATVRVLDTPNQRDVAVFGTITIGAPRQAVARRWRQLPAALRTPTRTKLGLFGARPAIDDVRDVVADADAVAELRKCRPGSCNFKLPASDMARARELIASSDASARLTAYVRQRMVEYAADYAARGDAALVTYDDRGGVRASDAFGELLAQSPYLYRYVPELHRHLARYPAEPLAGAVDALVWWQDEMPGLRPILTMTHLAIYETPEPNGIAVLAAKQLWANHYFEAAFELVTAVDREDGRGTQLLVLRRYRFDNLPSGGLLNIRGRVTGKLRESLLDELARVKREYEREAPASGGR